MKRTLILLASDPSAWQLQSTIAWYLESSAELYTAFIRDTFELMSQLNNARRVIRYTPDRARNFFTDLALGTAFLPQRGIGERERIINALKEHLAEGSQTVILWPQTPHLPAARLHDAFARLDDGADLVVGPCDDGNIYLVGLRAVHPELLLDLPNRPTLRAGFLRMRASQLGFKAATLPAWYTVNSYSDLQRLTGDLQTMPNYISPHTRRVLQTTAYQARELGA